MSWIWKRYCMASHVVSVRKFSSYFAMFYSDKLVIFIAFWNNRLWKPGSFIYFRSGKAPTPPMVRPYPWSVDVEAKSINYVELDQICVHFYLKWKGCASLDNHLSSAINSSFRLYCFVLTRYFLYHSIILRWLHRSLQRCQFFAVNEELTKQPQEFSTYSYGGSIVFGKWCNIFS